MAALRGFAGLVFLCLLAASCSTTRQARISAKGLYIVSPAYGLLGLGVVNYERSAVDLECPDSNRSID